MWNFEHPPRMAQLALRYRIDRMTPSECAARLATGRADIGLIPIAALATTPGLRILPGCVIAAKGRIRSLLLVRRASRPLAALRTVAADSASLTTIAHARILFRHWGNPEVEFQLAAANLDAMLGRADAAILIGDPALLALEERAARFERTGVELVYHDLAEEWHSMTDLPFVSAVWSAAPGCPLDECIGDDFIHSRDQGLINIDALARDWSARIPLSEAAIRSYLSTNIHYILDEECIAGMKAFFRFAAEAGVLPEYHFCSDGLQTSR
jgi:chorismate dehydratase